MRAVEFTADHTARVVDVAVPEPAEGEVLVQIASSGVCGSDVTALRGVHPFRVPPLISGHEGGGVVVGLGDGVDASWEGRAVALEPQRACGRCRPCEDGLPHLCRARLMLGMPGWAGTLAEYVTAPVACLHPAADAVPRELLALAEPLAVVHHALVMAGDVSGLAVAVLGGGPIGALAVHVARRAGARSVAATDPRPGNRDLCARLGADPVADPTTSEGREAIAQCDVVLVAAAAPTLVDDAVALLRPRGTVVQVGLFSGPVSVDVAALQQDEKTLVGSNVYTADDFAAAVETLEDSASTLEAMVTVRTDLQGAVDHLTAKAAGEPDEVVKLLALPGGIGR